VTLPSLLRSLALGLGLLCLVTGCRNPDPPKLYPAGEFSLTDQNGGRFGSAELRGKVWIAAFFFTRCPSVCPKLMARMKTLHADAQGRSLGLRFVAISVDPENDTPAVLLEYAKKNDIDTRSWSLLTGDYETVKKTVIEGFKVALDGKADPAQADYGILHGSHFVLVDREGQIRGYYRSSDAEETRKLLADAARISR